MTRSFVWHGFALGAVCGAALLLAALDYTQSGVVTTVPWPLLVALAVVVVVLAWDAANKEDL